MSKFTEKEIKNFEISKKNQLEGRLEIADNHIRIYKDEIKRAVSQYNEGLISKEDYKKIKADFESKIEAMERRKIDHEIESSFRRCPIEIDEAERIKILNELHLTASEFFPDKIFHGINKFYHLENIVKEGKISIEAELGNALATTTGRLRCGNTDNVESIVRSDLGLGASDSPAGVFFIIEPESEEERKNCIALGTPDIPLDRIILMVTSEETKNIILNSDYVKELEKDKILSFEEFKELEYNKEHDEEELEM